MRAIAVVTIIVVLLLSVFAASAQQNKVNFSGTWLLNADKSDMAGSYGGRRGRMATPRLVIEQKDNKLIVERFRKNRSGEEVATKLTFTLDGKKCLNDLKFGVQESVAKWSDDGKTLIIKSTMTMSRRNREFTMESTEKWSLKKGALIITRTRFTPRGERTSKAVYDKLQKKK